MANLSFDVVIIGAGPAGSSAAYRLATSGLSVLLVDRTSFPRNKPCAGGVTPKAIKILPFDIAPVIRFYAHDIQLRMPCSAPFRHTVPRPVCFMTLRSELDSFLLDKALQAGAMFDVQRTIESISCDDSSVCIRFGRSHVVRSRFLVGSDGVNSVVRRLLFPNFKPRRAWAIEAIVSKCDAASTSLPLTFEFHRVLRGYAWIFPKDDHYNIGLYTSSSKPPFRRPDLIDYAKQALGTDRLHSFQGFPIGMGGTAYRGGPDNVLLAGDAAGMAEPLFGEGIHNAIKSGQAAADAILLAIKTRHKATAWYRDRLSPLRRDLSTCELVAAQFYENVRAGYGLLTNPLAPGAAYLSEGWADGLTLDDLLRPTTFVRRLFSAPRASLGVL